MLRQTLTATRCAANERPLGDLRGGAVVPHGGGGGGVLRLRRAPVGSPRSSTCMVPTPASAPARYFLLKRAENGTATDVNDTGTEGAGRAERRAGTWQLPADVAPLQSAGSMFARLDSMYSRCLGCVHDLTSAMQHCIVWIYSFGPLPEPSPVLLGKQSWTARETLALASQGCRSWCCSWCDKAHVRGTRVGCLHRKCLTHAMRHVRRAAC